MEEVTVRSMSSFLLCTLIISLTPLPHSTHALLKVSNTNNLLTSASSTSTIQRRQFLIPHNILRARLGLPPLQWSESLAQYARWWASQRQVDCRLVHSGSTRYGENIFYGWGKVWTPAEAVAAWASEMRFYNYKYNVCAYGQECLHYTQMVWRQTTRIGCAQVSCLSGGTTFITCNYDPPGNIIGEKPY